MGHVGEAFLPAGGRQQAQLRWGQPADRLWDSEQFSSPLLSFSFFIRKMGAHPLPCGVVDGSQREEVKLVTV